MPSLRCIVSRQVDEAGREAPAEAQSVSCEHHWVHSHQPDFPSEVYWVGRCSQCHAFEGAEFERQVAPLRAERDVLAGQVAAIRALCDEAEATNPGSIRAYFAADILPLVASSPTTPEAPK